MPHTFGYTGICTVQPTNQDVSSGEFIDMVERCGPTRMNVFPTFLQTLIKSSRDDTTVLQYLQNLDEILISGLFMTDEDAKLADMHTLKIINCFGMTEAGANVALI